MEELPYTKERHHQAEVKYFVFCFDYYEIITIFAIKYTTPKMMKVTYLSLVTPELTEEERDEVVTNCDHLQSLKFRPTLPYAFTEQGIGMLSVAFSL